MILGPLGLDLGFAIGGPRRHDCQNGRCSGGALFFHIWPAVRLAFSFFAYFCSQNIIPQTPSPRVGQSAPAFRGVGDCSKEVEIFPQLFSKIAHFQSLSLS